LVSYDTEKQGNGEGNERTNDAENELVQATGAEEPHSLLSYPNRRRLHSAARPIMLSHFLATTDVFILSFDMVTIMESAVTCLAKGRKKAFLTLQAQKILQHTEGTIHLAECVS